MKKTFYLALLLTLISSCSHVSQENEEKSYPTDFSPYIKNFEALFDVETRSFIKFSPLKTGAPGRCLFEPKIIHINENMWKDFSEETREALIIHELGHCELGLLHTDDQESHIMNSFIGHNVAAYTQSLEAEITYMLSSDHPRFSHNNN